METLLGASFLICPVKTLDGGGLKAYPTDKYLLKEGIGEKGVDYLKADERRSNIQSRVGR